MGDRKSDIPDQDPEKKPILHREGKSQSDLATL
jgi:hypothetical protein